MYPVLNQQRHKVPRWSTVRYRSYKHLPLCTPRPSHLQYIYPVNTSTSEQCRPHTGNRIAPGPSASAGPITLCTLAQYWSSKVCHYGTCINQRKIFSKSLFYVTGGPAQALPHPLLVWYKLHVQKVLMSVHLQFT